MRHLIVNRRYSDCHQAMFHRLHPFQNKAVYLCIVFPDTRLGAGVTDHLETVIDVAAAVVRWVNVAFHMKLAGH